jgi:hypothetical protein
MIGVHEIHHLLTKFVQLEASMQPALHYEAGHKLDHHDDCYLLGITEAGEIYLEEVFGEADSFAQHILGSDGTRLVSVDESQDATARPLELPPGLITPAPVSATALLNFAGPRHRGMREEERVIGTVKPLTLATRIHLIEHLGLAVPPPAVLGIAESRVLSEASLNGEDLYITCRRLRLAIALAETRTASGGQPYDYETLVLHVVHRYNRTLDDIDLPPDSVFAGLPGMALRRPLSCLVHADRLYVTDGGDAAHRSSVHIWRIERD